MHIKYYLVSCIAITFVCSSMCPGQIPIPPGFPDASTTGYSGTLTPSEAITVTVNGTVVEDLDITGGVTVQANNVTIRNCRITGGLYGVNCSFGYTGTLIEDCTIYNGTSKGVYGGNFTARRCDVSEYSDCMLVSSNVLVEDCYLHDLKVTAGSHNDGIQCTGGSNITVSHCTIQGLYQEQTSALIFQTNNAPIDNVLFENNFLSGGAYTVYLVDKGTGYGDPTNARLHYNTFEKDSYAYGHLSMTGAAEFIGNIFHTGENIPENPPLSNDPPTADAGPDQNVTDTDDNGSEDVTLDGSASSDSDGTIVSYVWEENSSQIATGVSPGVTLDVSTHSIDLTVTDDDDATDTDTVVVTVAAASGNLPPTADAGPDQAWLDRNGNGMAQVILDGMGSSDPDGTIVSYVWEEDTTQLAAVHIARTTLTVGAHTITLTVTDDLGATDVDSVVYTVNPLTGPKQLLNLGPPPSGPRFTPPTDLVWPANPGETDICLWPDDKFCAVSMTIDDNTTPDHAWWVNMGNTYGWRFTWFVTVGSHRLNSGNPYFGTWEDFIYLFNQGHDAQSHTISHTDHDDTRPEYEMIVEYRDSLQMLEDNIPGNVADTLGYPFGEFNRPIAELILSGARGVTGGPNKVAETDWLNTKSCADNFGVDYLDSVLFGTSGIPFMGDNKFIRGWLCSHWHLIQDRPAAAAQFAYVDQYRDQVWVGKFRDVVHFGQERDTAVLTVTENTSAQVVFTLTDDMDDTVFNYPLTIKVRMYSSWTDASATQDGNPIPVTIVNHNGDDYALVNAVPDQGVIVVTPGAGNVPPTADAGPDQNVTDTDDSGDEDVTLNGSGSTDPDGSITAYDWEENSVLIGSGVTPTVTLSVAVHTIDLTVTDDDAATDTDSVVVAVDPPSGGNTYPVNCNTADQVVRDDGTFKYVAHAQHRVGGGVAGADGAAVLVFQLPALAGDETVDTAGLRVNLETIMSGVVGNVDLYGIDYRAGSAVILSDYYEGAYDGDPGATALQDNFATPSSSTGSMTTSASGDVNLAAFLAAQYTAGAQGGEYVFLRLNQDVADNPDYKYWTFSSADSDTPAWRPVLTINTVAGPPNNPPTADAGPDQNVTDTDDSGDESVTLDGSGSSDSDGTIVSYVWEENSSQIATGVSPIVTLSVATHTIDLTVTDDDSATDTDSVVITVDPAPSPKLETGVATGIASSWTTVTLAESYTSMVVVATPNYDNTSPPGVVRIQNAAGNSFDIRVDAAGGAAPAAMDVHWMVVEEGVYTQAANGVTMEAVKFTSTVTDENNSWVGEARTYANTYTTPIVVGQVMTYNDAAFSTFWCCNGTRTDPPDSGGLVVGKSAAEDPTPTRADETIGYIVIESGSGTLDGVDYAASSGANSILGMDDSPPYTYDLSGMTNPIVAVVGIAGMDGGNGGWAVLYGASPLTAATLDLAIDEDQAGDTERAHIAEQVAGIIFDSPAPPNVPPTADAGPDQNVDDLDDSGDENVTLDGSGSSDSDGTIISYDWEESSLPVATGVSPLVTLTVAVHTIDLIVTDDDSDTDTDSVVITVNAYVNLAPTADAGPDQLVADADRNGAENVTLDGSGSSDSDGTIVSHDWEESSAPIATGVSPTVSLAVGVHTIDLTVTDDDAATDTDSVVITVNGPPTADAGPDQTVTDVDRSGAENVTLDGSGSSDSDGTITSYVWEENSSQIATGVGPTVSLALGAHTIDLTVTDDDAATDSDSVAVTINDPPTADAGPDQNVYDADDSDDESATLDGSGSSDSDGTIVSYMWEENSSQIATGVSPAVTLTVGAHTIDLTVTDDDAATDTDSVVVTVDPYINVAPTADAGPDQNVTDSDDSGDENVTLDGSGSSDSDGTIVSYVWEENSSQIATGVSPVVTLSVATHTVDLTVTDDDSATGTDSVVVTVDQWSATSSQAWQNFPFASQTGQFEFAFDAVPNNNNMDGVTGVAQGDATWWTDLACIARFSPAGVIDVRNGGAYDADATVDYSAGTEYSIRMVINVVSHTYSVYVTPEGQSEITLATDYAFRTDQASVTSLDTWTVNATNAGESHTVSNVSVTEIINDPPTADAGPDQNVTDDDDGGDEDVTLDGSGSSDSDGTIVSYVWEENSSQIATGVSPVVTLSVAVHTIDLTVTDDDSATDSDSVTVTVNPHVNVPPTADAGPDQNVTDTDENGSEDVTLDGSGSSDSDGTIVSYVWEENSSQIATGVGPTVTLSVATHTIDLTVTDDDSATDSDSVVITVNPGAPVEQLYNGDLEISYGGATVLGLDVSLPVTVDSGAGSDWETIMVGDWVREAAGNWHLAPAGTGNPSNLAATLRKNWGTAQALPLGAVADGATVTVNWDYHVPTGSAQGRRFAIRVIGVNEATGGEAATQFADFSTTIDDAGTVTGESYNTDELFNQQINVTATDPNNGTWQSAGPVQFTVNGAWDYIVVIFGANAGTTNNNGMQMDNISLIVSGN